MKRILIIDPESSGLDLVSELAARDIEVLTWHQQIPFQSNSPGDPGRPAPELIEYAGAGRFDDVVAGGESGVSAAEWLGAHLRLPCSDPAFLHHRRDKNSMIARARERDVPVGWSALVTSLDEFDAVAEDLPNPVMIKPSNSAGSDMCRALSDQDAARRHCAEVLASRSIMGNANVGAVLQEYLDGPQFHVNTVAIEGRHQVTEVYSNRFRMPDGRPQLASGRTHRSDEPGIREVVDYALDVIDALGASVGATHTEVRLTSRGPRLVEFNGRLMGPTQPSRYFIDAQGFSQATVFADVLAGRHQAARAALSRRESAQYLGFYLLTGAASGVVTAFTDEHLRTLDSFRCIGKAPRTRDVITLDNRTTDADLGIVFLAHRSVDRLEADLALVEEMETNGMIHTISPL